MGERRGLENITRGGYTLQYWRADAIEHVRKTVGGYMSLFVLSIVHAFTYFRLFRSRYAFPISKGSLGKGQYSENNSSLPRVEHVQGANPFPKSAQTRITRRAYVAWLCIALR